MYVMTVLVAASVLLGSTSAAAAQRGILLLAHGGSREWNARVSELARQIDQTQPIEVAFGMATRRSMQEAVDRLNRRGVDEIVAVPLFVSSWSSVITASAYLLGLRAEAPRDLEIFARMNHSGDAHAPAAPDAPDHHADGRQPVLSKAPIIGMASALNSHPLVAEILASRARSISRDPAQEAVVLVAHGPVSDDENNRWLADMRSLADQLHRAIAFASVDVLTVRDDAPQAIRDAATTELRTLVAQRIGEAKRVLVVPLLLSFGGIERGIVKRLDGLAYAMPDAALMPDVRLHRWILDAAQQVEAPRPDNH